MITTEKPPLDADLLVHYGIKGMRWGLRKSKRQTGVTRNRGARIDRNDRHLQRFKDAESALANTRRSGGKVSTKLDTNLTNGAHRMLMGKRLTRRYYDMRIARIENHNARLKSGKLYLRDRVGLLMNLSISPGSLVVSYRPD